MEPPQPIQPDIAPVEPEQPNDALALAIDPWTEGVAEFVHALERLQIGLVVCMLGVIGTALTFGLLLLVPALTITPLAVLAPIRRAGLRLSANQELASSATGPLYIAGVTLVWLSLPVLVLAITAQVSVVMIWAYVWFILIAGAWICVLICLAQLSRKVGLRTLAWQWFALVIAHVIVIVLMMQIAEDRIRILSFHRLEATLGLGFLLLFGTAVLAGRGCAAASMFGKTFAHAVAPKDGPRITR